MRRTSNYSLLLPDESDFYSVGHANSNAEIIDEQMKSNQDVASAVSSGLNSHLTNFNNPHGITKAQIGLGNVPNVSTNNQTPTYAVTSILSALSSGETLAVAFGKIAKGLSEFISHIANKSNPHSVTKSQVGLGNVDNTSDLNKPVSTATQSALDGKSNTSHNHNGTYIPMSGSDSVSGLIKTSGEFQTTSANGFRLIHRLRGFFIRNDGNHIWFMVTAPNDPYGTYNEARPISIDANTGLASIQGTLNGFSSTAGKFLTPRTISLTGDVTGSVSFDGSQNVSMNTTVSSTVIMQTYDISMRTNYIFISGKLVKQGYVVSLSLNFYPYYTINGGSSYQIANFDSSISPSNIIRTCGSVNDREVLPVVIDENKITIRPISNIIERTTCGFSVSWTIQ